MSQLAKNCPERVIPLEELVKTFYKNVYIKHHGIVFFFPNSTDDNVSKMKNPHLTEPAEWKSKRKISFREKKLFYAYSTLLFWVFSGNKIYGIGNKLRLLGV